MNQSEFSVLKCILKDLTEYLTKQQSEPTDPYSDTNIASEVQLPEDDMRESDGEVLSSVPAPLTTARSLQYPPQNEDEIILSSEVTDLSPPPTQSFLQRLIHRQQRSPSSPVTSPRDHVDMMRHSMSTQGIRYQSSIQSEDPHAPLLASEYTSDLVGDSSVPISVSTPTGAREELMTRRDVIRSCNSLLEPSHTRQSSIADSEDTHFPLSESVRQNLSQRSCVSQQSHEDSSQPSISPNPQQLDSTFLQPTHILSSSRSPGDPPVSSYHPTPRQGSQVSAQPLVSEYGHEVMGSFLNRYYGMYSLEVFGQKLFFVVMENILPRCGVTDVYDLKGSWIDRNPREYHYGQVLTCMYCNTSFRFGKSRYGLLLIGRDEQCNMSPYNKHDVATTKKDNSYRSRVIVDKEVNQQISNRLREDVEFLSDHGLMDYSVLIGITNVQHVVRDESRFCFPK